jgi:peptide/nickel transport system permease protein
VSLEHNGATHSVGLPLPTTSASTRVFDALSGEGGGEGVTRRTWRTLRRLPLLPLLIIGVFVFISIFGEWLAPLPFNQQSLRLRFLPPAWLDGGNVLYLLGTDNLGRDVFARVLHGGRIALQVGLSAVSASLVMGLMLGMIAGYGPRALDSPLMLLFDAVRSFPSVLFALAVVTLIGPSLWTIILVVVVTSAPVYARIVRSQTLSLKAQEFILIERALGAGPVRILGVHVLPNLIGPLIILASMDIPVVITLEAGLSFLGLGVRPPSPSWGSILNDGYTFIRDTPWLVIAGGMPLIVTTLGFTFLGEALRDAFDPRLRGA